MARMKPAWYYQKQADEAEARATYFRNKVPTVNTTVTQRGPTTTLYYRSLFRKVGTNHLIYRIDVNNAVLASVNDAALGLMTQTAYDALAAADKFSLNMRGSKLRYSKASWYSGAATPVSVLTAWNTRYTRYYPADTATSQTHFSAPISVATGPFDAKDVKAKFDGIFGTPATQAALLGTKNGRASLTIERDTTSYGT